MRTDTAVLLIQQEDAIRRTGQLRETLGHLAGVQAVGEPAPVPDSAEMRVHVDFDPGTTNPVVMREALARDGFTVLSAGETTTSMGKGDA